MKRTENYNLPQFEPEDTYRLEDYNEAYETIDSKIKELNEVHETIDSKIKELQDLINTWTDFKNNGGEILGSIKTKGDYASVRMENKTGDNCWLMYARPTGTGMALCKPGVEHYNIYTNEFSPVYDSPAKDLGSDGSPWENLYLGGSIKFGGTINNTDIKTGDTKIFDVKRDTGDQIYFGNGSTKMVLDATEFNVYGDFKVHSKLNVGSSTINNINGYTTLPNGFILQWGYWELTPDITSNGYNHSVNFPRSFPTECLNVSLTPSQISKGNNYPVSPLGYGVSSMTNGGFQIKLNQTAGNLYQVYWMAIGY